MDVEGINLDVVRNETRQRGYSQEVVRINVAAAAIRLCT